MDDVKNQFKSLAKKFNNPFATSSSRFKGEGHKLGNGQGSSQQAAKAQQADWRKLQQERWEKERSSQPQRPQDKFHPSAASSAESQPSDVPSGDHSSAQAPIHSSDTSSKRLDGSLDAIISDGLPGVNLDNSRDSANSRIGYGSDPKKDPLAAPEMQNFDGVRKEAVGSCKPEVANIEPFAINAENLNSSESVEVHSDSSNVGSVPNESCSMFDPFSSHVGSLSTSKNMSESQMYQCPVCGSWWKTETEVHAHVDECLSHSGCIPSDTVPTSSTKTGDDQINVALGVLLSGGPSSETIDIFLRILRNIVNSPDSEKFRKIRLNNPKIHNTVGKALGGTELLEAVGFTYQTEEEEIWAVMDCPSAHQMNAMQGVISQLETCVRGMPMEETSSNDKARVQRQVDRQVRVFYAAPENMAAQMDLPDSFFQLSASEIRQEAAARKKKLEDSQLLISKASRDRLAAANKRKYKAAIIRIQFPDGVVLQGMFLPWEATTAIYEFVSSSLRDPTTQFTLVAPGPKKKIIPAVAEDSEKIPTLEEADLVPAVLVKFQCAVPDSSTFTGLHPDVLVAIEPLSSATLHH